ncbi:MAG TPA: GGDEF domain-containing protein, partial [Kineosporiaceae bacterium]|nr:GGDEF domain-containing protein [Kineosporiaceae bacterium]
PRVGDALGEGRRLLAEVHTGEYRADRLALAYEVLRAEEAAAGVPAPGLRTCLALAEARAERDAQRLAELFRARTAVLRCADERRALARTARLDALTGLVNRRGAAAAIAAAAGRPDPVPVALLLVDLDGLGRVNDRYGHLAGDVVLQRAAAGLRLLTRPQDVVARWNGDEFAVLASLEEGEAVALADRIRAAVRSGGGPTAQEPVTASVGVAVRTVPVGEADWLRRAELARHTAWRGGGDATVLA